MTERKEKYIVLRRSPYPADFLERKIRLYEDGYFMKVNAENSMVDEELTQKLNAVMSVLNNS